MFIIHVHQISLFFGIFRVCFMETRDLSEKEDGPGKGSSSPQTDQTTKNNDSVTHIDETEEGTLSSRRLWTTPSTPESTIFGRRYGIE